MRRWICLVGVLLASLGYAHSAVPTTPDRDFFAVREAFRAGNVSQVEKLAPGLRNHVLEPYVAYYQLKLKLDSADPDMVERYLQRYKDSPLAEKLRLDWLKSLARRKQWARFSLEYPQRVSDDTELSCYAIQAKQIEIGAIAWSEAKPLWFQGQDTPDACSSIFAELLARGELTTDDVWSRFRLAHEAGNIRLASKVLSFLPLADKSASGNSARLARDLERIDRNPVAILNKAEFNLAIKSDRELLFYALQRAARLDVAQARTAWVKIRPKLPEWDRLYGNGQLAFAAARNLHPLASEWFKEADRMPLSDVQLAWKARAALRAGAWREVIIAIDAMTATTQQEPTWRFWKARAMNETGHRVQARSLYATLAKEHHFYGLLAAEELGRPLDLASASVAVSETALQAFAAQPAVQRTLKLSELDLRAEAVSEWIMALRGLGDEGLLVASEFARRNGLYDRAINTADRTVAKHDFRLRYLTPYRDEMSKAAQLYGVDEAFMFGLARQESRFISHIISSAGAVGLMQLMPPTARWVAKRLGRSDYLPSQISDVNTNVEFGSYYLRYNLDQLDRSALLAAAAYNAGPGRARAWRSTGPLEGAIYAETIPFNETRDYVKKVLANTMFYARELGLPYVSLKQRLGIIGGRTDVSIGLSGPPASADSFETISEN